MFRRSSLLNPVAIVCITLLTVGWVGISPETHAECPQSLIKPPSVNQTNEPSVVREALDPADTKLEETMTASFRHRFRAVLSDAKEYLSKHQVPDAAVVLDLDETLLDNRAYFIIHKRYDADLWNVWMKRGDAPAIPEALDFVEWLQTKGFHLYFVTGRPERFRDVTVENLNKIGVSDFDGLYMKPDVYGHSSASHFKTNAREDIERKGQPVLIILGDQNSDLKGGHGIGFKLPNPIYHIP